MIWIPNLDTQDLKKKKKKRKKAGDEFWNPQPFPKKWNTSVGGVIGAKSLGWK